MQDGFLTLTSELRVLTNKIDLEFARMKYTDNYKLILFNKSLLTAKFMIKLMHMFLLHFRHY